MDSGTAIDLSREALFIALVLGGPIMIIGLVIGLVISILQAITQLHEQTLSFVPKIIAMGIAAAFFLPWLVSRLTEYTSQLWGESLTTF